MLCAARANLEDNPTWEEVMNGPYTLGYHKAAEKDFFAKIEIGPRMANFKMFGGHLGL